MAAQSELSVKQRMQLYWDDLSYTVVTPTGLKDLISGVTGHASPGELLAVMGSSGAGKTTLLNALSGRTLSGMLRGTLQLNGVGLVSRESFRKVAAFVTQDDVMMESQTPREILHFSAALRLPSNTTASERTRLVDSLIKMLHLERAASTIVGHPSRGGISGGERKRVNVGTELVTNPSVVFLDEPTSGLDAFTSVKVMKILKDLAVGGRTVVATIHQPASEIFASFDTLCLMHTGSCGYFGPANAAVAYFDALGHACPTNYNPADFLVGVLMRERTPHRVLRPAAARPSMLPRPPAEPPDLAQSRAAHPPVRCPLPPSVS
jgi:ABC-type multidrug transport system ATPase subunit